MEIEITREHVEVNTMGTIFHIAKGYEDKIASGSITYDNNGLEFDLVRYRDTYRRYVMYLYEAMIVKLDRPHEIGCRFELVGLIRYSRPIYLFVSKDPAMDEKTGATKTV